MDDPLTWWEFLVHKDTDKVLAFLHKWEWLRLKSYYDGYANGSNRWSIWYGTKSYKWEVISKQEADKRFNEYIRPIIKKVDKKCYTLNQKTALVSYIYNTGWYQMRLQNYIDKCSIRDIKYIMKVRWWNKVLKKRRTAELNLFNK